MPDQCDGCKFMRSRAYGEATILECHFDTPRLPAVGAKSWVEVQPTDWCGKYEAIGTSLRTQFVRGAAALTTANEIEILLPNITRGLFNVTVMKSCQIVNKSTKNDCILTFLNGNNLAKPIGYISCGSYESKEVHFDPGLAADAGLDIDIVSDSSVPIYVTAQGFMVQGE